MTAAPHGNTSASRVGQAWRAWRHWRQTRPFWGGLLVVLGGAEILLSEKAPLPIIIHIGLQGLAGYLIPAVMVLCGLLLLFHPVQQTFYSILAILLALGTWVTSNMGGFFLGMLLGVIGGALAFSWQRGRQPRAKRRRWFRPQREPSAGLALIRGDPAPDAGPLPGEPSPESTPLSGEPSPDTRPLPGEPSAAGGPAHTGPPADTGPGGARDSTGPGESLRGVTAILALPLAPLVLSVLAGPAPDGPAAAQRPVPAISASPTLNLTPTPSPSPSHSSPVPSPSPSTVPTSQPTPTPRPTRTHPRHAATASAPGSRASTAPATLTAGSAVLAGLSFDGVAQVPTAAGPVPMLKFRMASLTLSASPRLLVSQGSQVSLTMEATSIEFSGDVVLYTTKISGSLKGHQVTFTPKQPPAGLGPEVTLGSVVVQQPYATTGALQAGGYQVT